MTTIEQHLKKFAIIAGVILATTICFTSCYNVKDEIEEGGSVEHEIDLFIGACEDLLIEKN